MDIATVDALGVNYITAWRENFVSTNCTSLMQGRVYSFVYSFRGEVYTFISAWVLALSVQLFRAMRRPQFVGQTAG